VKTKSQSINQLMNNSSTSSQIALASAAAQASFLYKQVQPEHVLSFSRKNSTFSKFNIKNAHKLRPVGIKFDNNSARKYFALIHDLNRKSQE
jgi:hypothetical protein